MTYLTIRQAAQMLDQGYKSFRGRCSRLSDCPGLFQSPVGRWYVKLPFLPLIAKRLQDVSDNCCYRVVADPTPEEIAAMCREFRDGWTEREHRVRAGFEAGKYPPVSFPVFKVLMRERLKRRTV